MPNRRSLLKASVAGSALALVGKLTPAAQAQTAGDLGVASGDPGPDGVIIWTRVPEAFQTAGDLTVTYQVSLAPDLSSPVVTGTFTTNSSADYTVKIRVRGLEPFTRYYYGFTTTTGYTSVIGRTKTAPAVNDLVSEIRFAYFSCQDYTAGYYTVYANLVAQDDVDFCIHLGDNIYETGSAFFQGAIREDNIGEGESTTLSEYRQKYQLYISDPNLREARRLFPWINMWDDHEIYNDYDKTVSQTDPVRQQDAYQAFFEYMPIFPYPNPENPDERRIYRRFHYGSLLDIFLTDERQYRDAPVCNPYYFTTGCEGLDDPNRTMLGANQKAWLKEALVNSPRRWKFVMSEVMWQRYALLNLGGADAPGLLFKKRALLPESSTTGEALYINLDAWDGYPAEREEILLYIQNNNIKNVVVCTGDIHNCYAGELRPDMTTNDTPAVAVEVVGGSVTSSGLKELTGLNLNLLGKLLIQGANPGMTYLDLVEHVFTKVVVRPLEVEISYEAVDTVTETTATYFQLKKFTIPNGVSELQS